VLLFEQALAGITFLKPKERIMSPTSQFSRQLAELDWLTSQIVHGLDLPLERRSTRSILMESVQNALSKPLLTGGSHHGAVVLFRRQSPPVLETPLVVTLPPERYPLVC
jgi:hypothetical protein